MEGVRGSVRLADNNALRSHLPGALGVEVVWKGGPDVNLVATGNGVTRDEVLAVAQGVSYVTGDWPE